jgi:hypothetical protein
MRLFKDQRSSVRVPVLVDSGADVAFFNSDFAWAVGIDDYTTGEKNTVHGLGDVEYWLHRDLGVALVGAKNVHAAITLDVGFIPNFRIHGLVGRKDFFQAFDVAISESEKTVTLDLRDDATNVIDWKDVPMYLPPLKGPRPGSRRH